MISPFNTILVTVDTALQEEILLEGGLKLYQAADYNVEWNATVTGIVAGIPKNPTGLCSEVASKIKIGDEVAFSYRVISDRCFPKAEDFFVPMVEGTPESKLFTNQKGWRLKIQAMPPVHGKFNKIWIGLLTDRQGNHLDGVQGNESEVDNWLSKFKFSGVQSMAFNNLIKVKSNDYWRCAFTEVLAKKDKKGRIVAINDRVICEPIEEDIKHKMEIELATVLPYQDLKVRYYDRAKLISGGEEMGFRKDDIISFNQNYVERYTLWSTNYFLIKKRHILGRWQ